MTTAALDPATKPQPAPLVKTRLSIMMFLQYAIWGAWLPLLFPFLSGHRGLSNDQIGTMFAVGAIGAIIAPFIAGQIADRWFATQKFLGISHILGGVLVWQLATISSYSGLLLFSLLYSIIYSPTLSLTNSISFHHLPDRDRDFGKVRWWGTFGWICVGIGIGQWLLYKYTPTGVDDAAIKTAQNAGMADAFRLSAILGIVQGVFCFTLPNTPPSKGKKNNATFEAMGEIKKNPLFMLFLLAVPVSCIHQFYFYHASGFLGEVQRTTASVSDLTAQINKVLGVGGGGLMTIGQMAEVLVLASMPVISKKLSRKTLLAIGLCAYALRMALFAYVHDITAATGIAPIAILITGVALHGLCFGSFIFVAFMIVDEETTPDVRASAQSLFNLVIVGIGTIVGSMVAASVANWASAKGTHPMDYTKLFSIPMWASVACLGILIAFYPGKSKHAIAK